MAGVLRCTDASSSGEMGKRRLGGACLVFEGAAHIYGTIESLRESTWLRSRGEAVLVTWWWQRVADTHTHTHT